MNKQEFLSSLRKELSGLPQSDIEERITFYSEMIDDYIEDGILEDNAVSAVGNVDEIVTQVVADTSFVKIAKERVKPKRRLNVWEIILIILGSPIWISLFVAVVAVVLSVYVSLWAIIISLWAVFVAVGGSSLGTFAYGIVLICQGNMITGAALVGAAITCIGFSILLFYLCKATTKCAVNLTKKLAVLIKSCFIKKEKAQ